MSLTLPTEDTIAAIASAIAAGSGGIAVIRISGNKAQEAVQQIVNLPGKQRWESHKILYGHIVNTKSQQNIDEVLILNMEGPRSFTGENIVEIHCHGGLVNVQRVLAQVLEHPQVRRALPGEFSQRAVLNGKLNITQAEAINDLICARSEKAADLAIAGLEGNISLEINSFRDQLLNLLSEIEARIDFEENLSPLDPKKLIKDIINLKDDLQKLISASKQGALAHNGIKVAIIGQPNVGKSSLLNSLLKRQKAIVTDLPGTTRDVIESEIILEGMPITLIDTAGVRETNDKIEKIGIARSQQAIALADIIILVFDLNLGWTSLDENLLKQIPPKTPRIIVGNKSDLIFSKNNNMADIYISTVNGEGNNNLLEQLVNISGAQNLNSLEFSLNERQLDLVKEASNSLKEVEKAAANDLPWDFWTIDLRRAIYSLGELTGEEISETILDRIFSKFCIGK